MNKFRKCFKSGLQKIKDLFRNTGNKLNKSLKHREIPLSTKIMRDNFTSLICFVIYFLLSFYLLGSFLITLVIYFVSIIIALSPIGEIIMRVINNIRDLYTKQEKEYLMPIFEEVYNEVEKKHELMSKKIEIRIIDNMYVNVFAVGMNTIAVTRGAMETLSKEQLKGLIANTFGHLVSGDSIIEQIVKVGNGIFSLIMIVINFILLIMELIMLIFKKSRLICFFIAIIHFIFIALFFVFGYIMQVLISSDKRKNEFQADTFAHEVGYGIELIDALYLVQKISITGETDISAKLRSAHPNIAQRIGKLEESEGVGYEP